MLLILCCLFTSHSFTVQKGVKINFELIHRKSHGMRSLSIFLSGCMLSRLVKIGTFFNFLVGLSLNLVANQELGIRD